jgi:hypothetical protein
MWLTSDQWQAVGAVVGAATGIAALVVSVLALWFAQAGNRAAALVITWRADDRFSLENRGPAAARDVVLEVTSPTQRERALPDTEPEYLRYELRREVERLPVGYTIEDRLSRTISTAPEDYVATLRWRDDRIRTQSLELRLAQEHDTLRSRMQPVLGDRQVARLSKEIGEGIGAAIADYLRRHRPW